MKRTRVLMNMDIPINEYAKFLGQQIGLNKSEYIRKVLGEHIETEKQKLSGQETAVVESNIQVENAKQKYEEARKVNEQAEEWKRKSG